ncbi:MAG: hypothetical protein GXP15_12370 [Gammaproteobacteria bacterium]|nr:hypothetical protein [Gammaproteobacteria bacterium]
MTAASHKSTVWLFCVLAHTMLAGLTLAGRDAVAQRSVDETLADLEMRTKAEYLDQQERISGGAAVGVTFFDPADVVQLDAAYVYFSEPVAAGLEMQLATVDGRYLALFDYTPDAPVSGWVRLRLSLTNPEFLENYSLNEVALLLTNAETGTAYPVRWGTQSPADYIRIYINTEGAKSYFVAFDTKRERLTTRSCIVASPRSSFKFDRICDIPIADVLANNEIEIMRKRGADFGTPLTIDVRLLAAKVSN